MTIRPEGVEMFHVDRQIWGR